MVRALDTASAETVSVVTSYTEDYNEKLRRFLEGNDLTVKSMFGIGLFATAVNDVLEISKQTVYNTYRRVVGTRSADSQQSW